MAVIVDALGNHFPYSHSTVHDGNGLVPLNGLSSVPACDAAKFVAFGACFQASCSSQQTRPGILGCIAQSCFAQFSVLSEDCWSCILFSGLDITEVGMM